MNKNMYIPQNWRVIIAIYIHTSHTEKTDPGRYRNRKNEMNNENFLYNNPIKYKFIELI